MSKGWLLIGLISLLLARGLDSFRSNIWASKKRSTSSCFMSKDSVEANKVFIFGLGYVGSALAEYLQGLGWKVVGTCTNVNKALDLRQKGIQTYLFDEMTVRRGQSEATQDILNSNYILSTIPPLGEGQQELVLEAHLDDFRKARLSNKLKWMGYLSSTGVYGDCNGAWVTEERSANPDNSKTIARFEAEQQWASLQHKSGLPAHIFRIAGIYGPGRSALDTLLASVQNQELESLKISADDSSFISRVHVDDIVQVLYASMSLPQLAGSIYNVADDMPSTRYDVMSYSAKLLNLPTGVVIPTVSNEDNRGGSKRVDNAKMRKLLADAGRDLSYPDYRSGLSSITKSYKQANKLNIFPSKHQSNSDVANNAAAISTNGEQKMLDLLQEMRNEIDSLKGAVSSLQTRVKSLENDNATSV